jgi:hypothetical protein
VFGLSRKEPKLTSNRNRGSDLAKNEITLLDQIGLIGEKIENSNSVLTSIEENRGNSEVNDSPCACGKWFGYLNSRGREEKIPEECIICQKSIECMLQEDKSQILIC